MSLRGLFLKKSIGDILRHADALGASGHTMKKNLNVRDLTSFGIAAIVGAGIFSTIGNAAYHGGPALSVLFIFTAVACGFSALCYAQFASQIPLSGSAYTYAYASFGELLAWIIGWDLIMEYAIGNIAVAISWSDYFANLMQGWGMHIPEYFTVDFLSASRGYRAAMAVISDSAAFSGLPQATREAYMAWATAPQVMGIRLIFDLPAFSIVVLITYLVYRGIYESKVAGNTMVVLKLAILLIFIAVGAFYVNPGNWSPFAPNGAGGVLKGVAGVFFAYIGFDAISTTAEECKNPKRDLPRSMIYSLAITTVLYIAISLVLTGMVHYSELGVGDPLAYAFTKLNLLKMSGFISLSAIIAMASVLLVFQVGQPRIWMSMSRDGLLPPIFSKLHPKYRTPGFSTLVTGVMVAVPALFLNLTEVTDLTSIGTLFAFVLVSGGILVLDGKKRTAQVTGSEKRFLVPFYNSRYWLPPLTAILVAFLWYFNADGIRNFFFPARGSTGWLYWQNFKHKIPTLLFIIIATVLWVMAVWKQLSLIPVLGLATNLYLMSELGITNWMRFLVWLVVGLSLYFTYGFRHSKLRHQHKQKGTPVPGNTG